MLFYRVELAFAAELEGAGEEEDSSSAGEDEELDGAQAVAKAKAAAKALAASGAPGTQQLCLPVQPSVFEAVTEHTVVKLVHCDP